MKKLISILIFFYSNLAFCVYECEFFDFDKNKTVQSQELDSNGYVQMPFKVKGFELFAAINPFGHILEIKPDGSKIAARAQCFSSVCSVYYFKDDVSANLFCAVK